MEFITIIDVNGTEWLLNKAFIVGLTPTFGGSAWERGAVIHISAGSMDRPSISISGGAVPTVRLALGII